MQTEQLRAGADDDTDSFLDDVGIDLGDFDSSIFDLDDDDDATDSGRNGGHEGKVSSDDLEMTFELSDPGSSNFNSEEAASEVHQSVDISADKKAPEDGFDKSSRNLPEQEAVSLTWGEESPQDEADESAVKLAPDAAHALGMEISENEAEPGLSNGQANEPDDLDIEALEFDAQASSNATTSDREERAEREELDLETSFDATKIDPETSKEPQEAVLFDAKHDSSGTQSEGEVGLDDLDFFSEEEARAQDDADSEADKSDDEVSILSDDDETAIKLELAYAYRKMGDSDGAMEILQEVISEGNEGQRAEARELLDALREKP